ncbi:hypothetical protein, partial [Streptomyces sp. NPDC014685]|uniref:hypothetical protein n=1 Tax=Streptomyces sp. NPDC014685 TaxID=3364881 RepID=UPI0037019321
TGAAVAAPSPLNCTSAKVITELLPVTRSATEPSHPYEVVHVHLYADTRSLKCFTCGLTLDTLDEIHAPGVRVKPLMFPSQEYVAAEFGATHQG